ncbi:MAG: hypothetical protein EOO46_00625 [Flavobacterium sp.]|nr:MAG: hypothetical protein EOO46_00625 [Flavobacterium sp.]
MAKQITYTKTCLYCGDSFISWRSHARFCCDGCRASSANRTKPKTKNLGKPPFSTNHYNETDEPPLVNTEEFGVKVLRFWSEVHHEKWMEKEKGRPWSGAEFWKLLHIEPDGTYYYNTGGFNDCPTIQEYWRRKKAYWRG